MQKLSFFNLNQQLNKIKPNKKVYKFYFYLEKE